MVTLKRGWIGVFFLNILIQELKYSINSFRIIIKKNNQPWGNKIF